MELVSKRSNSKFYNEIIQNIRNNGKKIKIAFSVAIYPLYQRTKLLYVHTYIHKRIHVLVCVIQRSRFSKGFQQICMIGFGNPSLFDSQPITYETKTLSIVTGSAYPSAKKNMYLLFQIASGRDSKT